MNNPNYQQQELEFEPRNDVQQLTEDAGNMVRSVQKALLRSVTTAANDLDRQLQIQEVMQQLQQQEQIVNWLVNRRQRVVDAIEGNAPHEAVTAFKKLELARVDAEIAAFLVSAGVDRQTADHAVGFIQGPSRNGEDNGEAAEITERACRIRETHLYSSGAPS